MPEPRARSTPEQVEGDVIELSPEILAQIRGDIATVDDPPNSHGLGVVGRSIRKNHHERQAAQLTLRKAMAIWRLASPRRGINP